MSSGPQTNRAARADRADHSAMARCGRESIGVVWDGLALAVVVVIACAASSAFAGDANAPTGNVGRADIVTAQVADDDDDRERHEGAEAGGDTDEDDGGDDDEGADDSGGADDEIDRELTDSERAARLIRRKKLAAKRKKRRAKARKAIEARLREHVEHANAGDIDAYMKDFIPEHPDRKAIRAYAERVSETLRPTIEITSIEIKRLRRRAAKVHVSQTSSYVGAGGIEHVDKTLITYHLKRVGDDWRIAGTNRQRRNDDDSARTEKIDPTDEISQ